MAVEEVRLETERLVNLVRGFGWEMIEQTIAEGVLTVKLQKKVAVTEKPSPT